VFFSHKNWENFGIIKKKKEIQLILLIFQRFSIFGKRGKKKEKEKLVYCPIIC